MAGPYLVPCTTPLECPGDDELNVKYVMLTNDNQNPYTGLMKVKSCLMISQLLSEAGGKQNVWDKLLSVTFLYQSGDEINGILSRGIEFDGSQYCFLGFSASQLRDKACFFIKETDKEVGHRRAKFGILSEVISFADRAAKIQFIFEPFERSLQLEKGEFQFERNASNNVPSGLMSPELAETIKTECGQDNAASVVQVICPGFSGKLVRCDKIQSRASQTSKYNHSSSRIKALLKVKDAQGGTKNCGSSLTMGIVDYAKPYKVGCLDVYAVMFLEERGVTRDYLLGLQSFYHEMLENLGKIDLTSAKYFLRQHGRKELLSKIENGITSDELKKIREMKRDEIRHMQSCRGTNLRVLVTKSREVFGIADPYNNNSLKSDECVFNPCLDCLKPQEQEQFEKAEQVLVIPLPCYSSSGIQVLKLVRDGGFYENLKDCLVLPSQTEEQVVANKYFVSWDENLIPHSVGNLLQTEGHKSKFLSFEQIANAMWSLVRKTFSAISYLVTSENDTNTDGLLTKSKLQENGKFQGELIQYFATFKSNDWQVFRAQSHFERFASLPGYGPSCSKCQKLGKYLSPDFAWNTKSYDDVEKYLATLDTEKAQDSAAQSSTTQPVWREMTKIFDEFFKRQLQLQDSWEWNG